MSQEEEMMVVGRIVVEYGEVRKKLAAVLAEGERHGDTLQKLVHYFNGSQYNGAGMAGGQKCPDLAELPTVQQLQSLADDASAAIARKKALHAKLKEFGAEPKD